MTLADLNASDAEKFVDQIGWVFEHSPWVAERAWRKRPFATLDDLHRTMVEEMKRASPEEQLALLCAHPDLGARARMSAASTEEQAGAGLDALSADEFARLLQLNQEYRKKFGFPFLYAVKGSTKQEILAALGSRLGVPRDEEFEEALRQVAQIARFRLEELFS